MVCLTDENGDVAKEYAYDAFGNEENIDTSDDNPFRYAGEYYDTETGTYYLRARYYDPAIGRFAQEDPARHSTNWYLYCYSNPVRYVDPIGIKGMEVHRIFRKKTLWRLDLTSTGSIGKHDS